MGDGTDDDVPSTDPLAFIWWRGVPLCRRPPPAPHRPPRPRGMHLRGGMYLTGAELVVYRLLRRKKIPVPRALRLAKGWQPAPRP
jgi:hypothetical protein